MKRTLPLAVIAAAALGLAFTMGGVGTEDRCCPSPVDRVAKVTGAWLYVIDFGDGPFEGELQLFADGNAVMNNTVLNEGTSHLTTALGAWKRTGRHVIAVTTLIRIVNADGELLSYEKVVGELTVNGDVISGEGAGLIYLPGQNPLDPEETPVRVYGPSPLIGGRLSVETLSE